VTQLRNPTYAPEAVTIEELYNRLVAMRDNNAKIFIAMLMEQSVFEVLDDDFNSSFIEDTPSE